MIRRDLRDDAGGVHVAAEDLAVEAERDDALLDARAAESLMPMIGQPVLIARSMTLTIFSPKTSPERAAEDGEVLGEDADLAAVDRAVAGDDAVAVGAVLLQAERGRAVPGQLVELDERALVEQRSIRSRAVFLPLACCFSTAFADPACTASSLRRSRSASLPAVVWMSSRRAGGGAGHRHRGGHRRGRPTRRTDRDG
jgi:hypothetical protein